jgi:hypothetical protein
VYATRGSRTLDFLRYDAARDTWLDRSPVPPGDGNNSIKAGTDLVCVGDADSGHIYLLKGYYGECYRYDVARDSWRRLANAPVGQNRRWPAGSWLAFDGQHTIYAHKAKYHEFYSFDTRADTWNLRMLHPMPLVWRTNRAMKAGEGSAAAYQGGAIYALKGNNTHEFWLYEPDRDTWTPLDTAHYASYETKKKRVRAGGDIAALTYGVFLVVKGNGTQGFYRYVRPYLAATPDPGPAPACQARTTGARPAFSMTPNPLASGVVTVRCNLPAGRTVDVGVYDALGRAILRSTAIVHDASFTLDLRSVSEGTYFVQVTTAGLQAVQKLVIGR